VGDYETVYVADVSGTYPDNVIVFSDRETAEKVSTARRLFLDIASAYSPDYSAPRWYSNYIAFLVRRREDVAQRQRDHVKGWDEYIEEYFRTIVRLAFIYNVAEVLARFLRPVLAVDIRGEPRIYPVVVRYNERIELLRVDRLYMDEKAALEITIYGLADYLDDQAKRGDKKAVDALTRLRKSYAEELRRKYRAVIERALSARDLKLDPKRIDEILSSAGVKSNGVESFARDWIKNAYVLEEEGRNLAYALSREEPAKTPRFFKLLDTVAEWAGRVVESLEHARSIAGQVLTPESRST
jgi:hypothetical protein